MEPGDGAMALALQKSGLRNWIGLIAGYRFAQRSKFRSTTMRRIYWCYEMFTELTATINIASQLAVFLTPGTQMVQRCLSSFPVVTCLLCFFISNYPRFKRREYIALLENYEAAFSECQNGDHLEGEIKKGAKRVRLISMILVVLEFYPMLIFCGILPIVNEATGFALGPRVLVIPSLWPWDPLASFKNYVAVLFLHICGLTFVTFKKIGFEEGFFIYASRQICLLKHLRYNLERIFDLLEVKEDGSVNMAELTEPNRCLMKKKLTGWVKDHQKCLRLFREFETLYEWPIFVYFGATIIILCTSTYVTSDNSVDTKTCVLCGAYVAGIYFELLFMCRMGDFIKHESAELSSALTGKYAFILDNEEYRYLRMIMTRCNTESVFRASGGFPLTISTFIAIVKSSYSYYTMLKEVNGK